MALATCRLATQRTRALVNSIETVSFAGSGLALSALTYGEERDVHRVLCQSRLLTRVCDVGRDLVYDDLVDRARADGEVRCRPSCPILHGRTGHGEKLLRETSHYYYPDSTLWSPDHGMGFGPIMTGPRLYIRHVWSGWKVVQGHKKTLSYYRPLTPSPTQALSAARASSAGR